MQDDVLCQNVQKCVAAVEQPLETLLKTSFSYLKTVVANVVAAAPASFSAVDKTNAA